MKPFLICLLVIVATSAGLLGASPEQVASEAGMKELLGAQVPLGTEFFDETGAKVSLARYFGKGPVILAPAYYQCPNLCTLVLNGLLQSAQELKLDAGKDYQIVVVSFDPREKSPLAAAKKQIYTQHYGRPGAADGWHFLTGNQPAISGLLKSVGYQVAWDETTHQFAHPSSILILTPQGKVARYFPGIEYPPHDVRLALIEASANRLGSLSDRVFLLCFHYNPTTGKYGVAIWRAMQLSGCGTVLLLAAYLGTLIRKER